VQAKSLGSVQALLAPAPRSGYIPGRLQSCSPVLPSLPGVSAPSRRAHTHTHTPPPRTGASPCASTPPPLPSNSTVLPGPAPRAGASQLTPAAPAQLSVPAGSPRRRASANAPRSRSPPLPSSPCRPAPSAPHVPARQTWAARPSRGRRRWARRSAAHRPRCRIRPRTDGSRRRAVEADHVTTGNVTAPPVRIGLVQLGHVPGAVGRLPVTRGTGASGRRQAPGGGTPVLAGIPSNNGGRRRCRWQPYRLPN